MKATLTTDRLELCALGLAGARAQVEDRAAFFAMLAVAAPPLWPPPLNDEESMRYWLGMLARQPDLAPWAEYAIVARAPRRLVGNGGFKGPPSDGAVEIGYSILPHEQGRGFATEAARALVAFAGAQPGVRRVLAHTLEPEEGAASINVLRKCGFTAEGAGPEPGTLRWVLRVR